MICVPNGFFANFASIQSIGVIQSYRTDIDGLRAIAVVSVILFHFGYLPNGYLGVDVFFVVSGYLITGILFESSGKDGFSLWHFFERRIRRILPLVLLTSSVALLLGLAFMLPDDLENLCQSVVATHFSANNILLYVTHSDYWAVQNEYKPLMHTWSLGIEEQFYFLYPFMFLLLRKGKRRFLIPALVVLTAVSLGFFLLQHDPSKKFYFIQYRFFELAIGGIAVRAGSRLTTGSVVLPLLSLAALLFILTFGMGNADGNMFLVVSASAAVLVTGRLHFSNNGVYTRLLSNTLMSRIGKISFSLYMWHYIVIVFARYAFVESIRPAVAILLAAVIAILSVVSYRFVERPFRDKNRITTKWAMLILGMALATTSGVAFHVYRIGGIVRDVPELGLSTSNLPKSRNFFNTGHNIHSSYNEAIWKFDRPFENNGKIKVLVAGNSFARDFCNVLLESAFKHEIELRYYDLYHYASADEILTRFRQADVIFITTRKTLSKRNFDQLAKAYKFDPDKAHVVGTKDFGNSNGVAYNQEKGPEFCTSYRMPMKKGVWESNSQSKKEHGKRYIDLIGLIADRKGNVPVFTPDCRFISQDTQHLTRFGAAYFGELLQPQLERIFVHPKRPGER